jgi:hypothetical protein
MSGGPEHDEYDDSDDDFCVFNPAEPELFEVKLFSEVYDVSGVPREEILDPSARSEPGSKK